MQIVQGDRPLLEKLSKTEKETGNGEQKWQKAHRPTLPECATCRKTNHSAKKCRKGTGEHLRPKRSKPKTKPSPRPGYEESPNINDKQSSAASGHNISQKPDSKN